MLSRGPSGDRIARSCRHTGPDLTIRMGVKDRIAFQNSEPEIWQTLLLLGNFRDFPGKFGLRKIFFGLWKMAIPYATNPSEQLPCRSAEVNFSSVFLCQRCREIWREILVKFSVLRFPGFGCATENFSKISRQKRCEKRKISRKFHSAGAIRHQSIPPLGAGRLKGVLF